MKEIGEYPRSGKLPKRGTTITCHLCFKKGHNKKGCPHKEEILQGNTTFPSDMQAQTSDLGPIPSDVQAGSSNPPKKTCGICSQLGHTKNGCPQKKTSNQRLTMTIQLQLHHNQM
ncbi:unnamed protein product [Cuscuta epithymum]|uniref:CCHC-type domain-containing protein n=1 Tax=Cuscuta epithymum TaxID=186058 RepID=A0AAV0G1D8_9ASTE|nr:unnamed protein product [Cuscuta epithymum]